VRYFRALAVVCLALGLLVQVAAQAAALPQARTEALTASAMDCSEMAQGASMREDAKEERSDKGRPCDMTLDCLIAMNCIPPIALADPAPADAPFPAARIPYQPNGTTWLKGAPIPPESPPPQAALTA
jgi:hypothetical protein